MAASKATPPVGGSCTVDELLAELNTESAKPQTHGAVGAGFDWSQLIPLLQALITAWLNRPRNPTP